MKKIVVLFLSIFLITGCNTVNKPSKPVKPSEEVFIPKTHSFTLAMVGDALIHQAVYADAKTGNSYDFRKMITDVKKKIEPYDLAFYNQESILGGSEIGLSHYPRFNAPYEVGDAMLDAGFNLVSLANNHTLDRGEPAIINSCKYWNSKDVMVSGSFCDLDSTKPKIREMNNISYTMLAYTTTTNGLQIPNGKSYYVSLYDKEKVKQDIESIRDKVDIVMVSMHWGNEYTHVPTYQQEEMANYLSSLGVDIIIGHHPHVIQPITKINQTVVIYSLGNFLSAQDALPRWIGMLASLKVTKTVNKDNSVIEISDLKGELLYNNYNKTYINNFKVIPFENLNNNILYNYENIKNEYNSIIRNLNKDIITN
ncbi:MAG: CapA family protein [Bacilli bacterium]